MNKAADLIIVAKTYCTLANRTLEQASYQIFKDQRRLQSIADGKTDPRLSSYVAAMCWFNDKWPKGADWPKGIERPSEKSEIAA